jgi:hypothetical protein
MRRPTRRTVLAGATVLAVLGGALAARAHVATPAPYDPSPAAHDAGSATHGPSRAALPAHHATTAPTAPAAARHPAAASFPPAHGTPRTTLGPGYRTVTVAYDPGRTVWDVTAYGVRLRVWLSALPRSGEPVTWRVRISDYAYGCCNAGVRFGDGFQEFGDTIGCKGMVTPSIEVTHTYNKPGRQHPVVFGQAGDNCDDTVYLRLTLDVARGKPPRPAQGPRPPVVDTVYLVEDAPFTIDASAHDPDGYLRWFVVDWGDGTTDQVDSEDPSACPADAGGWPRGEEVQLGPQRHTYVVPGSYTVSVTVYSTGCDGSEEQVSEPVTYDATVV